MAERVLESVIDANQIAKSILLLRGQKILLDVSLAALYEVETRSLVLAVKRNLKRLPPDFMFLLTAQDVTRLRSQIVISNGRGGRRSAPYAFTEQGVAMLLSVIHSPRGVLVNIEIVRACVRLRAIRSLMEPAAVTPKRSIGFADWKDQGKA